MSGKLEVEVGDTIVNSETFLSIAQSFPDAGVPFEFVKEISNRTNDEPDYLAEKCVGKDELDDGFFHEDTLEEMKSAYSTGKLIKIRVPVVLRPKTLMNKNSHLDLYLRALPENEQPFSLFSRGPSILSAERRYFSGAAAWGALVADDPVVAEFLGDAENPAHTRWNSHAEKVENNWRMWPGLRGGARGEYPVPVGPLRNRQRRVRGEACQPSTVDFVSAVKIT